MNKAFALVELFVVIAVIAVIAAIAIPAVIGEANPVRIPTTEAVQTRFNIERIAENYELLTDKQTHKQYLSNWKGGMVEVTDTNQ